jgi:hypothetical protein
MKKKSLLIGFLITPILLAQSVNASTITYDLQDLGANSYRYSYTINNDGSLPGGSAIQLFDILFDPALYQETSLTLKSDLALNANWSQQFLASAPGVPVAFDVLAIGAGLTNGSSISGFAVDFSWLGAGLPSSQGFEIYDASNFNLLESGITTPLLASVPLPGAMSLVLSAFIGGAGFRKMLRFKSLSTLPNK